MATKNHSTQPLADAVKNNKEGKKDSGKKATAIVQTAPSKRNIDYQKTCEQLDKLSRIARRSRR